MRQLRITGTISERLMARVVIDPDTDCWNWIGCLTGAGYGQLRVDGKAIYTHRLAYEEFIGPILPNLHVLHRCDNTKCLNPKHLFIGDALANKADCIANGRQPNTSNWLEPDEVDEIRRLYWSGHIQADIAKMFGVSRPYISRIISHERR